MDASSEERSANDAGSLVVSCVGRGGWCVARGLPTHQLGVLGQCDVIAWDVQLLMNLVAQIPNGGIIRNLYALQSIPVDQDSFGTLTASVCNFLSHG